jgi:pilus biogenesis lipoprotein CpaD
MTPDEGRGLSAFLSSSGTSADDDVTLVVPATTPTVVAERRSAAVARALQNQDVASVRVTRSDAALSDTVTVQVVHYIASHPACSGLSENAGNGFADTPPDDFGCATATNLALMAARPQDLVAGKPPGGADAAYAARGVELYRSGALSHIGSGIQANGTAGGSQSGGSGGSPGGGSGGGTSSGGN